MCRALRYQLCVKRTRAVFIVGCQMSDKFQIFLWFNSARNLQQNHCHISDAVKICVTDTTLRVIQIVMSCMFNKVNIHQETN